MGGLGCASLDDLRSLIGDCHRCDLGCTRTRLVFGVGDPDARVVFIGEAPGRNEDLQGEPFVGAAGQFLNELLSHAGLKREQVYIANVLKCRPPGNRDPLPGEIEACTPFLREQIRLIDPPVLVTLGNFATKFVLKTTTGITQMRGTIQHAGKFIVLPIFHPAVAIYDRTKRDVLIGDFVRLREVLDNLSAASRVAERLEAETAPDPSVGTEPVLPNPDECLPAPSNSGGGEVAARVGEPNPVAQDATDRPDGAVASGENVPEQPTLF